MAFDISRFFDIESDVGSDIFEERGVGGDV